MASTPPPPAPFEPPGPGSWTLDTAHFPRPATAFVMELFPEPARCGFTEATASYGLLLDHIEWGFVNRWAYLCPRPVRPLVAEPTPMTRQRWDALVSSVPTLAERLARSARVFTDRRWRADVARWDEQTKPQLGRRHRQLQAVQPSGLEPDALLAHVDECRDNLRWAIEQHHRLNVTPVVPVGDFLVHVREWTRRPAGELLALVATGGPVESRAGPELARVAAALRDDRRATARLSADDDPREVLAALGSWPGEVGRAVTDYLDLVGDWSVGSGSDVGEPCLRELPQLLLQTMRSAGTAGDARPAAQVTDLRAEVPADKREDLDALLAEARASHRVRDERAVYCDVWAYGLTRRALLAAGRHAAAAGVVEQPEHLLEADHAEVRSLVAIGAGPSPEELAARARYRQAASEDDVPLTLGDPPRSPVPTDWLPAGAARTERAFRTYVQAMSEDGGRRDASATVRGQPASPGSYEGRARVIRSPSELDGVRHGDVVVTAATTPAFNVVLALAGAVVTDRGGTLSHTAIVAREFGIPAVVGTREATRTIPDGAQVRVDGGTGEVVVLD